MSEVAKLLSREDILNVKDIVTKTVSVPDWGGSVIVKGLTGAQRNVFEQSLIKGQGKSAKMNLDNAMAKLVALTIVDADGKRLFSQADIEALGQKSGKALAQVYTVASELSGLTEDDVEELTKN
ncbi:hypothetical protein [Sporolactobacillus terrae]|uniref:Tail assembly chaperone n=1 Tax=Sporolactobacillus terrae TaxID=269673 RepID=A0A5K7X086_9BACL|nr:hypothetical protein [Sporolactobacillus terrae]BBN97506.1 hypothetical protein St703_02110 [Sporolactobacillus terrae]